MQPAIDIHALYREAERCLDKGQLQQAADLSKQILDVDPGSSYGLHIMSSCFRATGDMEQAQVFAEMAVKNAPQMGLFHAMLGQIYLQRGDVKAAGESFKKAQQIDTRNPMPLLLQANVKICQRKYDEALKLYNRARAISDTPMIDEAEGALRMVIGDFAAAEQMFDRIIERQPKMDKGYVCKGGVMLEKKQFDDADTYFSKAIALNEQSYEAWQGLTLAHFYRRNLNEAVACASQAYNIKPVESKNAQMLGEMLMATRNYQASEQLFRRVLVLQPGNLRAMRFLVNALLGLGKRNEADDFITKLLAEKPDDQVLQYFHAMINGEQRNAPPMEYVFSLFNDYAEYFDGHLDMLQYHVPSQTAELLISLLKGRTGLSLLDLGCGTGKMAAACKAFTGTRVGVDLAPKMLEKAQSKKLYDELHESDIVQFMLGSERRFDLITSGDVMIYVGDLDPVMRAVRQVMNDESLFVFSVERLEGDHFHLNQTGRYSHSLRYAEKTAGDYGLTLAAKQDVVLRIDGDKPIDGMLLAFRKAASN